MDATSIQPTSAKVGGGVGKGKRFIQARYTDLSGFTKFFTTYQTAQFVVIEDISLAVTFKTVQFSVLIYGVMLLLYYHEYQELFDLKHCHGIFMKLNITDAVTWLVWGCS